jgi:transposase
VRDVAVRDSCEYRPIERILAKALSNTKKNRIREVAARQRLTIGLDLGDRTSRYCILDEAGEVVSESQLPTTKAGLSSMFEKMPSSRIALEVGTHSPWVSRHLAGMGHEVIVANSITARQPRARVK